MVIQVAVIALSCSLLVAPAQQQEASRSIDVKSVLSGRLPAGATVAQQGPFTSVSIPIAEENLPMLRAMLGFGLEDEEKVDRADSDLSISLSKVYALAVGSSLFRPSFIAGIASNDVEPLEFTDYYYYYIAANFGDNVLIKKTKFTLKGSGNGFVFNVPIIYDPASIVLLWVLEDPTVIAGLYKLDVKISGTPKVKGLLCVGCS